MNTTDTVNAGASSPDIRPGEAAAQSTDSQAPEIQPSADQQPLEALLAQIQSLQSLADKNHQNYLRVYADLENFRKRTLKDKEDYRKSLIFGFLSDLAPILDNFQLGLVSAKQASSEVQTLFTGFQMIADQFEAFLKSYGVETITPEGESFDPNLHECIAHVAHEHVPENYIIQTIRRGYKVQDRLIRPANVVVSSGTKVSGAEERSLI